MDRVIVVLTFAFVCIDDDVDGKGIRPPMQGKVSVTCDY